MQEPFKEMYISLYKDFQALQFQFYKLADEADESLLKTSNMYRKYLEQHTRSKEEFDTKFADLYLGI